MFDSHCFKLTPVNLPKFTGLRVMMMPLIIGDAHSASPMLEDWKLTLHRMFEMDSYLNGLKNTGKIGYITIDEKEVPAGKTHRRAGLHVDGLFNGRTGAWGGGPGGTWGSAGNGMLTVSNVTGCRAWSQYDIDGYPGHDGECEHLRKQLKAKCEMVFEPGVVYWVDGLCVHESMPMKTATKRQFVRLSLPSDGPWFEGYTENPLGIKPPVEILPRREFMDS